MQPSPNGLITLAREMMDDGPAPSLLEPTYLAELGNGVRASLVLKDEHDKLRLYNAIMGECLPIVGLINTEIDVEHVVVHPAQSVREGTGEMDLWTRVVLITPDGTPIGCGSAGILKSLTVYNACFGRPPWKPAAKFKVKQKSIGQKRWYYLEPVYHPLPK